MRVLYSDDMLAHVPRSEMKHGGMIPARECPARAGLVRDALAAQGSFVFEEPTRAVPSALARVHDSDYLAFLEGAWPRWQAHIGAGNGGETPDAFPLIFPVRTLEDVRPSVIDGELSYYAMDTGTPLTAGAWMASLASVTSAAQAATCVSGGERAAFALTRPPGHHAAAGKFGGYCFLNTAAVAGQTLLDSGADKVAVLDIDYHHGNGTQSIFYERGDVLVVNIHADPDYEFPFFLGRAGETGRGAGEGATLNLPLARGTDWSGYAAALEQACRAIAKFGAQALVVSWGFDTFEGDPLSTFQISRDDFARMGERIAGLDLPTVIVLEGGYATASLGENVLAGLAGFAAGGRS